MIIEPNSNIRILKSDIELDELNQLTFASKSVQESYFKSLPYIQIEDSSYQRKEGVIRFPLGFDEAIQYNYVMYQNEDYSNKWFYAFITDCTYVNDETSFLKIETDVFQTWQFDIVYKPSFIEREMLSTSDDVMGANTQPENLELGEYVNATEPIQSTIGTNNYICISVADDIIDSSQSNHIYNGIASGLIYMIVDNVNALNFILKEYADKGKGENVVSIFMIPTEFLPSPTWINIPNSQLQYAYISDSTNSYNLTGVQINTPTKLNNQFTPVNKKLLTFPYRYLLASNNAGVDVIYKYEDFKFAGTTGIGFNVIGNINAGCSIKYVPTFYKGIENRNYEESFNGAKFPVGSWINDVYTNWLTQNGLNIGISTAGNILQIVGGVSQLSGGATAIQGASNIASGISGIASTVAQIYQHSLAPNQVEGNVNSSDVMFGVRKSGATFYNMSIKEEYARIIDNFFSMFGYKTNLVKLPNLNNRSNWNYVKTINCNLLGDIPQKDMQKLKEIFNNGITLWHNPSTFLDYSQTNS